VLRSVARAGSMKDLAAILDTASKVLPLVVAVSGRVGSDTPLICQQSGMRGVIVEETAEQHFLKHNDAGSWIQDSAVMLSVSKEVPWYLVIDCYSFFFLSLFQIRFSIQPGIKLAHYVPEFGLRLGFIVGNQLSSWSLLGLP